eukprot:CAMPEP_0194047682 /NCGR_PEP_ID=MMETSP0009_2-20130614/25115_1 /TAXON_ID=210454 /ORGANISM="Grammatophora oceanica, Strain CCMP 410" /LENGTH=742 /DNA_ID=CAMNT_0038693363 /DNA_START=6 /DNA_END=2234 /DNA_ORIENTATION=-
MDNNAVNDHDGEVPRGSSPVTSALKIVGTGVLLMCALATYTATITNEGEPTHRRLSQVPLGDSVPSYMSGLMKELKERKKLMEETPPEEVKYWFEYTGELQKYYYRYSKSRQKADSFEGRDDSGVTSSRFVEDPLGNNEYREFLMDADVPQAELSQHARLLENCLTLGSTARPQTGKGTLWNDWFGTKTSSPSASSLDRCRILFTLNTVGAGRGTTMLWETNPPQIHAQEARPWISEQETAATHLERNLKEIDAMCATGQVAARVQVLVCEPIPARWTDWMDSLLVNCGGKPAPLDAKTSSGSPYESGLKVEERPSPVQVVVTASAATADTCHDLKSGFMEKRMQDLILAPPYLGESKSTNPAVKTTHPDLVSSDDHDLYVALKWSSLITARAVHGFLQASADLAAAAASPKNQKAAEPEKSADGVTVALSNAPSSPFLIPSFVRVSYVSEENSKVAKWRMHGDFFHPASWEICKDSYDMTWIPDSLSGSGGVNGLCYADGSSAAGRKLSEGEECGQWWVYMAEEQMPTTPEVYANENVTPLVQGGSNYIWMLTERQRREVVKQKICQKEEKDEKACGEGPQAVMPLGDLESFLINFTPNTALGKKHVPSRRPGYSREKERELNREKVRERKQLKDQEDIEKALFDYTIYPAALFHKDATLKAARSRDFVLAKNRDKEAIGPQAVKSTYYDVTITKPREAVSAWCQSISRKGLCTLYSDYFRTSNDDRCAEACGLKKDWARI